MKRRPTAANGTKLERRKETRFPVSIPMQVSWKGADGVLMKEEAFARLVNAYGGLLEMANYPDLGTRVTLTNLLSAETMEARVLATPNSREGVSHGIVVELVAQQSICATRERQRWERVGGGKRGERELGDVSPRGRMAPAMEAGLPRRRRAR